MDGRSDDPLTAADMTPAEAAAWKTAVGRGLNISRADLRALLTAAGVRPVPQACPVCGHPDAAHNVEACTSCPRGVCTPRRS